MKPEHVEPSIPPSSGPAVEPLSPVMERIEDAPVADSAQSHPWLLRGVAAVAVVGAVGSGLMWAKLSSIQEQLARQSADTGSQAVEARVTS